MNHRVDRNAASAARAEASAGRSGSAPKMAWAVSARHSTRSIPGI